MSFLRKIIVFQEKSCFFKVSLQGHSAQVLVLKQSQKLHFICIPFTSNNSLNFQTFPNLPFPCLFKTSSRITIVAHPILLFTVGRPFIRINCFISTVHRTRNSWHHNWSHKEKWMCKYSLKSSNHHHNHIANVLPTLLVTARYQTIFPYQGRFQTLRGPGPKTSRGP